MVTCTHENRFNNNWTLLFLVTECKLKQFYLHQCYVARRECGGRGGGGGQGQIQEFLMGDPLDTSRAKE